MHEADQLVVGELYDELKTKEENLWRTKERFDAELMNQYFASDFFEFGRSGRMYSRAEMIFDPSEAQGIDAKLPLEDFHARYLTKELVQITYISELLWEGEILRGNRSSLWSKIDGRWQLRFHQGTPVEDQQ
jgi:hypothetical protein